MSVDILCLSDLMFKVINSATANINNEKYLKDFRYMCGPTFPPMIAGVPPDASLNHFRKGLRPLAGTHLYSKTHHASPASELAY